MEKTQYPAVLILSAVREDYRGRRVIVYADSQILNSDEDLNRRSGFFTALQMRGGLPYEYTVVAAEDAQEAVADIRAGLEGQVKPTERAEDDQASPAPVAVVPAEDPVEDDTTNSTIAQADVVVMVVRYQGTGQAVIPTGPYDGATDELVEYHGYNGSHPPDRNVKVIRDRLELRGFRPSYTEWKWLDRGAGPRRRREVYRRNGSGGSLYEDRIDKDLLRQAHQELAAPRLPEAERLALYRAKALAGEGVFSSCENCPLVQDCPEGWGACDRKAQASRARQAEIDRPRSHKNPAVHPFYGN